MVTKIVVETHMNTNASVDKPFKIPTVLVSSDGEEEDVGALIHRECQLRKAEAAIALEQRDTIISVSDHRLSTCPAIKGEALKAPARADGLSKKKNAGSEMPLKGKRKLSEGEEELAQMTAAKKKYSCECSFDACTNNAVNGGVCVRHGAKVKRCSREGCTNQVQKGGVCVRHGAKVKRCRSEGCTNQAQKPIKLKKEECVESMGQRSYAAMKDAPIRSKKEECA